MRVTAKQDRISDELPVIAVVGPCASGKSTLVKALRARGHNAREVAQEHSYVETMWQRITRPDLLIYLDVSQEVAAGRRASEPSGNWWRGARLRLSHARRHADLRVDTDQLSSKEVLDRVLSFIKHYLAESRPPRAYGDH